MRKKYNDCRDFSMAFYPKPRIYKILVAIAYRKGESKAKIVEEAVNIYINSMEQQEQKKCIEIFEALSDKKKKNPRAI